MRTDTKTVSINASPAKVVEFLADPQNLPRWAVGFAKSVRKDGSKWIVVTGHGEMGLRIGVEPRSGVVDFFMSPAPGLEVLASSRVVANGGGSEYIFTQFQGPDMPSDVFEKNILALEKELSVLRSILEIECPL